MQDVWKVWSPSAALFQAIRSKCLWLCTTEHYCCQSLSGLAAHECTYTAYLTGMAGRCWPCVCVHVTQWSTEASHYLLSNLAAAAVGNSKHM
jgi:hypothetical protein